MGPGSGTSSQSSVKMRGSGKSLSRFELENAGLRNELDPFWAWKCASPELPGRVWLALWLAANPWSCRTLCVRAEPANLRQWRVKIKEILKIMVSGTAKSAKKCKMVMLRNGFFGNLWKWYARNGNSGLKIGVSRAAHTQYAYNHMEVYYTPRPHPARSLRSWLCHCREHHTCSLLN